jgi:hypothetical protein
LLQQSVLTLHVWPVGLHDDAGTSHLPPMQLSEQQSVFCVHVWWNDLHVAQLTPGKHAAPKQQPLVHVVELQTHWPLTHFCPVEQALPVPHAQWPFVHESARFGSHVEHAPPFVPHVIVDGWLHVLPVQHPVVHVCEQPRHVLFTHVLVPHDAHAAPPDPHTPC